MSYNNNFYNNFTFQNKYLHVPPPPRPPPFYIPPKFESPQVSDQEMLNQFAARVTATSKVLNKQNVSISDTRQKLIQIVLIVKDLKNQEQLVSDQKDTLSDKEWNSYMMVIEEKKNTLQKSMADINDTYLEALRKALAKRTAKRLRLKKLNIERKKEKEEMLRERKERSRKIDEAMQKIKDDIDKVNRKEESKLQADMVLKEVLRKKGDAKKWVKKLEALVKLRKARLNTAKGRGEHVSESDAVAFNNNIEKLKSLWTQKLCQYEKEEIELRATLTEDDTQNVPMNKTVEEVTNNLSLWKEFLFGGSWPQVDFHGDIGRFLAIRSHWDTFISEEGSALPVGWVPPPT